MKHVLPLALAAFLVLSLPGCRDTSRIARLLEPIVVNSLDDDAAPPEGVVTLRSAIARARLGQRIVFDPSLDGGTIELSLIAREHTRLKGEVMGMREEPSGPVSYLVGYFPRDYGASALFSHRGLYIDASALPHGITLAWAGGAAGDARVLAVYGDLTMINVTVTGGVSRAVDISTGDPDEQPWTLARGGGVAVWGKARLIDCRIWGNRCFGDFDSSRDRGAFGGGVYANLVDIEGSVIGGNSVVGGGAAGGGVYSVGGADPTPSQSRDSSEIRRSAITGNRISALFTYGAGVYSDGGGIGRSTTLQIENCTIAHNVAEPVTGLPPFLLAMGYWRGGGVYISNGSLRIDDSTIVLNEVYGVPRTDDLDKSNLAGGIAATIGNAHAVEQMSIAHSIVAGNTVHEVGFDLVETGSYPHDIFTGSLMHFISRGRNRFGALDFSQMLVPVGERHWTSLCRRHYPKHDDQDGVEPADVLDLAGGVTYDDGIPSLGVEAGDPVPLWYMPTGSAVDRVPADSYPVQALLADYGISGGADDDFPSIMLGRIQDHYGLTGFADAFTDAFEGYLASVDLDEHTAGNQPYLDPDGNPVLTLDDVGWYGPGTTWPKELVNWPYIEFWHHLDRALLDEGVPGMDPAVLGDDAWGAMFSDGTLVENPAIELHLMVSMISVDPPLEDQLGTVRPRGDASDIGAIEGP